MRQEGPLLGAVFTRVAASHIRVGTFQYFLARNDIHALRLLADHAIARHYSDATEAPDSYVALLESVAAAQADLIAQWMSLGFIHGVMNTDNTAISGETIDYGPCAFMDAFHSQCVFSSIDSGGRYAWGNQPDMGLWNLTRSRKLCAHCCLRILAKRPRSPRPRSLDILSDSAANTLPASAPNSASHLRHQSSSSRSVSIYSAPKRSISPSFSVS